MTTSTILIPIHFDTIFLLFLPLNMEYRIDLYEQTKLVEGNNHHSQPSSFQASQNCTVY